MANDITSPESPEQLQPARVEPRWIGLVNALLEGHEGIATMRTLDPARGLVCFWIPEGQREDFDAMVRGMQRDLSLTLIDLGDPILEGLEPREWLL
ncbi:DUF4911 domain-containing protein [Candidatus Sumerlaeota bacterium]|nr:DUF4911 domain-containing protein [Candidatus Sumerlaeota bacterium]